MKLDMKFISLLAISCCLTRNVWAQPKPCVSPPWITGGISVSTKDGAKTSSGMFTYDAWGQQIRFRNYVVDHNSTHFMDLLMDFKQKVFYDINHAKQTCEKKVLETSFHPMQVPPNSAFFGQAIMGTTSVPDSGLLVNNWVGEITEIQAMYMSVFSEYTCLPITTMIHTPNLGWTAISFFNQVLTVVDPNDFVPPAFCQQATSKEPTTDFITALLSIFQTENDIIVKQMHQ